MKFTFLGLQIERVIAKTSQYFTHMVIMVFGVSRIDEDVVNVNHDVLVENVSEDRMHEILEDGGRVSKAIRHDQIFIVSGMGHEGSFPFIPLMDMDEVVCITKVKFRKYGCGPEFF